MKALTENTEDTGKIYNEFKQLQQKWNEIKQIPVGKINELWKHISFTLKSSMTW